MSEHEYDDFDEAAYEDDLRAQNAVDDAKYETPEQDEPDWYYYGQEDGDDEDDMPSDGRYDHDKQAARGALPTYSALAESVVGYSNEPPF